LLGDVKRTSDTSVRGGVLQRQGPCNYTTRDIQQTYAGEFEVETEVEGYAAAPAFDEYGPLDLNERYAPNPYGFTNDVMNRGLGYVNLNSPVWQHNQANRSPSITYPTPAPEAFHFQTLSNGTPDPFTLLGGGNWRSSNTNPLEGAGYPFESDDPDDLLPADEVADTVLHILSGNGAGIFDPTTQTPKKYFWAWPEAFTQVPDIASTFRPTSGSMDGVTPTLTSAWQGFKGDAGTNRTRLEAGETYFQEVARAGIVSHGFIEAKRHAYMRFPSVGSASSRWLVWNSPGTNGHSPFEEVVNRF